MQPCFLLSSQKIRVNVGLVPIQVCFQETETSNMIFSQGVKILCQEIVFLWNAMHILIVYSKVSIYIAIGRIMPGSVQRMYLWFICSHEVGGYVDSQSRNMASDVLNGDGWDNCPNCHPIAH